MFKTAKVLECKILAGKFHSFILETETPLAYKPGQYINIKVSPTRMNSYSIVADEEKNKLGLLIDTSPGGPGSKYFENLKEGNIINFLGPFGKFVYNPDGSVKHILFLATGSGCAPLRSMIDYLLKVEHVKIPITLYLGLRNEKDIFWQDYFKELCQKYPNFNFVLAISRPGTNCQEKTGHITDLICQNFFNMSGLAAYLCGNISMIEEAAKLLISRGVAKEKIYTEKF